jgi:REP element-mobilizing transposase RayT
MAYHITFTCYGTWLHGDGRGSADRAHAVPGTPYLASSAARLGAAQRRMTQPPFVLDAQRRSCVLEGIKAGCARRGWGLHAAHVRECHVHVVVAAETAPEVVMSALKSYASAALNNHGLDSPDRRRWTRHGSTRYLWRAEDVAGAITYVVLEQGPPMAVYDGRSREA